MAAGPVVYSEYTQGSGDDDDGRRARVVQQDGTGDLPLPKDLTSAAVSPDGTRIAQMGLETFARSSTINSWLRVTAGDGSAPVKIVQRRIDGAADGRVELLSGPPVWSPDGTRVIVRLNAFRQDETVAARRLVCVVATRSCRGVGRAPADAPGTEPDFRSDVIGWQAVDGPIVDLRTAAAADDTGGTERVRCGTPASSTPGPATTLSGLPGSPFGSPLRLRGVANRDEDGGLGGLLPTSAGAVTTQDGTLAFDTPEARLQRGALRCRSAKDRRDGAIELLRSRTTVGMPRLRLRAGGRTTTLPTPAGLRRGDGLRLVGTDTGGAVLVTAPTPALVSDGWCEADSRPSVRRCDVEFDVGDPAPHASVPRAWRYRVDLRAFEPVTTLRRSGLRTLADADALAVASGDAVLAVDHQSIQRVPLDGTPPTTIARGRDLRLDLSAW
jgi:hypothetical protein